MLLLVRVSSGYCLKCFHLWLPCHTKNGMQVLRRLVVHPCSEPWALVPSITQLFVLVLVSFRLLFIIDKDLLVVSYCCTCWHCQFRCWSEAHQGQVLPAAGGYILRPMYASTYLSVNISLDRRVIPEGQMSLRDVKIK